MTRPAFASPRAATTPPIWRSARKRSEAEIAEICDRYGFPAKYRKRGGVFGVIEIFVEGCQMLEVLTDEMQREYTSSDHHRELDGDDRGAGPAAGRLRLDEPGRGVTAAPMFEAEAIRLREILLAREGVSPLLNLGSSTRAFREIAKPHIERELFAPLAAAGIAVFHSDLKAGRRRRPRRRHPRSGGAGRAQGAGLPLHPASPTCWSMSATARR